MLSPILPLHKPLFTHIPASSYLLSIIGNNEEEYAWIMHNFINLRINNKTGYDDFYKNDMWYNCPYIVDNIVSRDMLKSFSDDGIIEMLMQLIDNGYYILTREMERYHISSYNISQPYNTHNLLIYGYDFDQKLIYIMDFYEGKLKHLTGNFDEVKRAYYDLGCMTPEVREKVSYLGFHCIKKRRLFEYNFWQKDITLMQVKDYILSSNKYNDSYYPPLTNDIEFALMEGKPIEFKFGLSFYDVLIERLINDFSIFRAIHLLYIHKDLMVKRLEYFKVSDNQVIDSCYQLMKKSLATRNLYLKYIQKDSPDAKIKIKIIDNLKVLQEEDFLFMSALYNNLSNYTSC